MDETTFLKLNECFITGWNLYWARTHKIYKAKSLTMRDARRTWQALRQEYLQALKH